MSELGRSRRFDRPPGDFRSAPMNGHPRHVRSSPVSDQTVDIADGPVRAKLGIR
jgi:hypothetical protein